MARTTYHAGLWAEGIAGLYLMVKGYRILARRYKTPLGEIDLVARRRRVIVFVEVKARPSHEAGCSPCRPRRRAGYPVRHDII